MRARARAQDEEELQRIYQWIDEIPLSRPKRNISRDFADGVLVAEVVAHYYPRMVELHNYPSANSFAQKLYNWQTLSKKVFKKIGLAMSKAEMEALSNAEPGAVEQLLKKLQVHVRAARSRPLRTLWRALPTSSVRAEHSARTLGPSACERPASRVQRSVRAIEREAARAVRPRADAPLMAWTWPRPPRRARALTRARAACQV